MIINCINKSCRNLYGPRM